MFAMLGGTCRVEETNTEEPSQLIRYKLKALGALDEMFIVELTSKPVPLESLAYRCVGIANRFADCDVSPPNAKRVCFTVMLDPVSVNTVP